MVSASCHHCCMQSLLQGGSFDLPSNTNACTAADSLHTMVVSIASHSADDSLSGIPDSLLQETSRAVQQLFIITDSVFITTGVTAGLLA